MYSKKGVFFFVHFNEMSKNILSNDTHTLSINTKILSNWTQNLSRLYIYSKLGVTVGAFFL